MATIHGAQKVIPANTSNFKYVSSNRLHKMCDHTLCCGISFGTNYTRQYLYCAKLSGNGNILERVLLHSRSE